MAWAAGSSSKFLVFLLVLCFCVLCISFCVVLSQPPINVFDHLISLISNSAIIHTNLNYRTE